MPSQIDKFNERKKKTEALKQAESERKKVMTEETPKTDWNEKFKESEAYKEAEKNGLDLSVFKVDSEDSYKKMLEELDKKNKETSEISVPAGKSSEEIVEQKSAEEKPLENKGGEKTNEEEKTSESKAAGERETLNVGNDESQTPSQEMSWIEEKRKFWEEYAKSVENKFENDPDKDVAEKTFNCALSKDEVRGEIKYTAPNAAQISKDSHLAMYQGLVKDALKNNLTITFGQSLDDKQKAMLLAACLMNNEKYQDGSELAMVNPPKIDLNAEYFKDLPDDVKQTLTTHVKQTEINQKMSAVRAKLHTNAKALNQISQKPETTKDELKAKEDMHKASQTERVSLRQEQIGLIKEGMTTEQIEAYQKKQEEREKILAARLGIIPEYKTTFNGKERTVSKEEGLDKATLNSKEGAPLRISKEVQQQLMAKYGAKEGK